MSNENPQGGRSKLLPILLVVNSLLLAAILAVVLLRPAGLGGSAPASTPAAAEAPAADGKTPAGVPAGPGPTLRLPDLTIHLRNPEADRYARVGIELELHVEEDRAAILPYLPMVRDSYLAWFSDRTVEELQGSEGLTRAKNALLERFEAIVPGRRVRALFITDFVVQ